MPQDPRESLDNFFLIGTKPVAQRLGDINAPLNKSLDSLVKTMTQTQRTASELRGATQLLPSERTDRLDKLVYLRWTCVSPPSDAAHHTPQFHKEQVIVPTVRFVPFCARL